MSERTEVFSVSDPFDRSVVLNTVTWDTHILKGHPEMTGNETAVKRTVENPEFIHRSTWNPKAEIFCAKIPESSYPNLYTRVIIGYNGNNKGSVETALFTKSIKSVRKGELLYGEPSS